MRGFMCLGLLGILLAFSFIGCDNGNDPQFETYTVTFNADNGAENTTQTITEGSKATKPTNPIKNGYGLVYWFNESTGQEWNFDTIITENITLKARWGQDLGNGIAIDGTWYRTDWESNNDGDTWTTFRTFNGYDFLQGTLFDNIYYYENKGTFIIDSIKGTITLTYTHDWVNSEWIKASHGSFLNDYLFDGIVMIYDGLSNDLSWERI